MDLTGASPPLLRLGDAVMAFCSRTDDADDHAEFTSELRVKRALINMLEMDFARDAARFAATYDEEVDFNPSPVSWLRESCNMTSHAAATAVHIGEQAPRLAQAELAVTEGRVGLAHLGLMAGLAAALDESGSGARFHEDRLLARAEVMSVQRFRTLCSHVRHEVDSQAFLQQQLLDRDWRTLELKPCGDGVAISGFLDAEGGALVRTALDPLAARTDANDARAREQRYADALVELCSRALDVGDVPQRASQRAHVHVTTSLETLLGVTGAAAGELEVGAVIAGATVRRLACDSTITRVLLDAESQVVDVGRSQRVVSGATRRALNLRDQGCRWPGCDRPPSWTSAHHVVHWAHRGRTDADNLVLLCRRHHWSVHEGGWQLIRRDDGIIAAVSPLAGSWLPLRPVRPVRSAAGTGGQASPASEPPG
jgi:hypothetical protein